MIRDFGWSSLLYLIFATRWTLALAAIAFIGGAFGGLLLAIGSIMQSPLPRTLVRAFVQVVQGIPLLMLLFMSYFGVSLLGYHVDAWMSVSIALIVYASAFLGEIWSGSLRTVPAGQWEAASAVALNRPDTLRFVIIPQAIRIAIPPTVGFLVQLVKGTALASIVGFVELTRSAQVLNNLTFTPFTIYSIVAAIYFTICWPLSLWSRRLETKLAAPYRR